MGTLPFSVPERKGRQWAGIRLEGLGEVVLPAFPQQGCELSPLKLTRVRGPVSIYFYEKCGFSA